MPPYHGGIAPDTSDPTTASEFAHLGWTLDDAGRTCRLAYGLDGRRFEETVELSVPADGAHGPTGAALDLVALVSGVSYYKAAAPGRVDAGAVRSAGQQDVVEAVYGPGLAEFRWANGIDLRAVPAITSAARSDPAPRALPADGPVLVPVGGGKDSIVTVELLASAGHDVLLFAVNDHPAIEATIEAAGLPAVRVRRHLDPALFELNAAGALNGHVPVTAIVSALAVVTAVQHGCSAVAMSNERSASAPNLVHGGVAVNHQYSKSLDFERRLRRAVHDSVSPSIDYFSLLRPLSELAIMATFARLERYHPHFTSCNRAFAVLAANRTGSWCGECDKCRFVFLALAPFLPPEHLVAVFGRNLLEDTGQLDGFRRLVGLVGTKPFECVGEVDECRVALDALGADPEWSMTPIVATLRDEVGDRQLPAPDRDAPFVRSVDHLIPARFLPALEGAATLPSRAAR